MKSLFDQENLRHKVDEWKSADPNVCIIFRPYVDPDSTADFVCLTDADGNVEVHCGGQPGLLFVHQTHWQRRLLRRYGSICLLDATYTTTRYALPLFFLCVHANVRYIVVATLVTQNEDSGSIAEALNIIRSCNPEWTATLFMVDFCESEIDALNSVLTGSLHLLCPCTDGDAAAAHSHQQSAALFCSAYLNDAAWLVVENWLFRSLQSFRFWRTLFSVSSTLCSELQAHYDSADYT